MTHADLVNDALLWFLIVMTLLLVMCVAAVFFAPAEAASSPVSPRHKAPAARPAVAGGLGSQVVGEADLHGRPLSVVRCPLSVAKR